MNYSCQLWPARKELSNSAQTGRQFRTFGRSSLTSVLSRPRYPFPSFKNVRNLACLHIAKANTFICSTYFLNRRPGASVTKKVGFKMCVGGLLTHPQPCLCHKKGGGVHSANAIVNETAGNGLAKQGVCGHALIHMGKCERRMLWRESFA